MILDYSMARPSIAALKNAGVTAVGRYIGWDSVPGYSSMGKNITKGEANTLRNAGIAIFLAFEYGADAPAHGSAQGHADGQLALSQLRDLGAPPDMGVYFCCDWDIPDYNPSLTDTPAHARAKLGPVGNYFKAIQDLRYPFKVGVYGGYYAVRRVLDAGLATLGWQTVAWSGGKQDKRAVLLQLTSTPPIKGTDINVRLNTAADFGQWPRPGGPPPSAQVQYLTDAQTGALMAKLPVLSQGMADNNLPYDYVGRLQAILADVYGYPVVVDGTFGADTTAGVRQLQARYGLTQDGIVGPMTWAPVITGEN